MMRNVGKEGAFSVFSSLFTMDLLYSAENIVEMAHFKNYSSFNEKGMLMCGENCATWLNPSTGCEKELERRYSRLDSKPLSHIASE